MHMNSNNMIKVDNFNHKKVYVGTPVDFGETIKSPKRCLFVTPYKGIASIFTCDRNLYKQGATPGVTNVNIGYEEWGLELSKLNDLIDTIHVKIEGDPDHETLKFKTSGYIYEIDVSKYKNNIYQYDWMDKEREFLIVGFDEIEFVKKQKHETTRIVKGYPSENNELKMTCESVSNEYNNEVEVYQYQFYDMIKPKEYVWVGSCNIIINDKYDKYKLPESHYISKGIWVDQFYIDDKYQGKGYGSKIMLMLIQKHGVNHMACEESNTIALHLYNKMGFNQYDKDGDLIFLKRDNDIYEESKIDDIRNKVNPYSNKLFFHVSFDDSLDGKVLKPRIPSYIFKTYGDDPEKIEEEMKKKGYYEDFKTPRVCFSNSIEGCLNAILNIDKVLHTAGKEIYAYIPEKPIKEYKHKTNKEIIKEKLIFDAKSTQEIWILEDVKVKLYGTIVIDKIYDKTNKTIIDPYKKKSEHKQGYNHFKWHWQCNPKILQESALSSTKRDDLVDSEFGIPNKRKYPLTDKNHVLKAVQFFKFADMSDRPELAKRIINKAKEFNMDYSNWNSIKEYLPKEFMKEGFDMNYDRFGNPLNRTLVQGALMNNASVIQEASQSRKATERRNKNKNLKYMGYDAETKNINFKYSDDDGNIGLKIDGSGDNDNNRSNFYHNGKNSNDTYINISPKTLRRESKTAMSVFEHELGHAKQRKSSRLGEEMSIDDDLVRTCAAEFAYKYKKYLNTHDQGIDELHADYLSAKKVGFNKFRKGLEKVCLSKAEILKKLNDMKNESIQDLDNRYGHLNKRYDREIDKYCKKISDIKKTIENNKNIVKDINDEFGSDLYLEKLMSGCDGMSDNDYYEHKLSELEDRLEDLRKSKSELPETYIIDLKKISEDMIKRERTADSLKYRLLFLHDMKHISLGHPERCSMKYRCLKYDHLSQINPNYKHPKSIIKEYIVDELDKNDYFCEEYQIDEIVDDIYFEEFQLFMEEDDNNKSDFGDNKNNDFDISSFGSDTFSNKSPNNEYDETEVKILNALIADEQHAVGRYFDAAKNSKDKNLSRLYADIGAEERFHAEQLMYSKSMLTGEEYTPFDPEVKKEYEELLAMGMDEESAMTTAIDKRSMSPNYDDEDDSDVDEIQKDVEMLEYAIDCHASMLSTIDMICESDDFTMEQRDHALNVLLESYIIQEAVDNVRPGGNTQNVISNPVYQLLNGFSSFLKFIRQLCDKFKNFINKNKVKQMRLREFIKTNGIFGIFKPGVSLYFYDPKTPGDLSIAPFQYIELMNNVAVDIMKEHGLTTGLDKINLLSPTISIRYSSATQGLAILNGVVLTKTKIIVDDSNKNAIEELFFGFSKDNRINVNSPDKYDKIMRSGNIYNKLNNLLNWTDLSCKKISKSIQAIQNLQQDTNSIYYTNRNQYNSCIEKLKQVEKCFNKFLKALVSDINTVMKINNGILEATNAKDDDFNRQMTK